MKMSRRAKRMDNHHARAKRAPGFNLIALMDIFTILVFFLLVNTSDVQEIPLSQEIDLPESVIDTKPRETVVVEVASDNIVFAGEVIASVTDALEGEGLVIAPLRQALARQLAEEDEAEGGIEVTIMGDRSIPYDLLRKVMATCTDVGFAEVSLAVMQAASPGGGRP